jgi:hypothetical protein
MQNMIESVAAYSATPPVLSYFGFQRLFRQGMRTGGCIFSYATSWLELQSGSSAKRPEKLRFQGQMPPYLIVHVLFSNILSRVPTSTGVSDPGE